MSKIPPIIVTVTIIAVFLTVDSNSKAVGNVPHSLDDDQDPDDQDPEEVPLNGFPCTTENYPFIVSIILLNNLIPMRKGCAGTLIDSQHVLTAASCLSSKYSLMVVAGLDNPVGLAEVRHVTNQIPHINYTSDKFKTDIAILVLEAPIYPTDHISYAHLPKKAHDTRDVDICKDGLSLSWGHTVYDEQVGKLPDAFELNCAQLTIVSPEQCKTMSRSTNIHKGLVCTLSLECQGDQGGPIMCNGEQFAVISWKSGCSNHFIEKHSRVDANMEFIRQFVKQTWRSRGVSIFTIEITKWITLIVFIFPKWFYQ